MSEAGNKRVKVPKLTLTYFGIGGRGEPIRLAAAAGKIPFTNKAISFKEFSEQKSSFPLGQVPILEIEEGSEKTILTQSVSILRYFGKMGGLYPSDLFEAAKVDATIDTIVDLESPLDLTFRGAVRSLVVEEEWTAEQKLAIRKRILDTIFPKYYGTLNKQIEENGTGFLVGDSLTIADLKLLYGCSTVQRGLLDGIPSDTLDAYPGVKKCIEKINSVPEIKAWREKYPDCKYGTFDYNP